MRKRFIELKEALDLLTIHYPKDKGHSDLTKAEATAIERLKQISLDIQTLLSKNESLHHAIFSDVAFQDFIQRLRVISYTVKDNGFFSDPVPVICKENIPVLVQTHALNQFHQKDWENSKVQDKIETLETQFSEFKTQIEDKDSTIATLKKEKEQTLITNQKLEQELIQLKVYNFDLRNIPPAIVQAFIQQWQSQNTFQGNTSTLFTSAAPKTKRALAIHNMPQHLIGSENATARENWLKENSQHKVIYDQYKLAKILTDALYEAIAQLVEQKGSAEVIYLLMDASLQTSTDYNQLSWEQRLKTIAAPLPQELLDIKLADKLSDKPDLTARIQTLIKIAEEGNYLPKNASKAKEYEQMKKNASSYKPM